MAHLNSADGRRDFPKPIDMIRKFESANEDTHKPFLPKQPPGKLKPTDVNRNFNSKPIPKPPINKTNVAVNSVFKQPKPPSTMTNLPPRASETSRASDVSEEKVPAPKPLRSSSLAALQSRFTQEGAGESSGEKSSGPPLSALPGSHSAQNALQTSVTDRDEEPEEIKTSSPENTGPPKPPPNQKPTCFKPKLDIVDSSSTGRGDETNPKKKTLPSKSALGNCPAKPQRPPHVDLQKFKTLSDTAGSSAVQHVPLPPQPPATTIPAFPKPPPTPAPGVLSHPEQEESYDDVGILSLSHTGQTTESPEGNESEEMYEDLESRWPVNNSNEKKELNENGDSKDKRESKDQKRKREREEKKRLEQEKKERKEREKKELEARKKFKITGPIQVLHKAKARVDCKGGKNDFQLQQGEIIDIIRITGNPEGRWLGRNSDGHFGYVKTEMVDVDSDRPRDAESEAEEQYDDVGTATNRGNQSETSLSWAKGQAEGDGEIYDCPDDPHSGTSFPPPPPELRSGYEASIGDEYDDVISTAFPAPPPLDGVPQLAPQVKTQSMDPKKKKKFEREEKEFRRKFKFEGEIQVLSTVTIIATLSTKKWGSKDLPLRAGETIDIIAKPSTDKVIGRNSEGKFGYVSTSNIVQDSDIYDDVGEDCIYDND